MSVQAAIAQARRELDEKWKRKFPFGEFRVELPKFNESHGQTGVAQLIHFTKRPNSHGRRWDFAWRDGAGWITKGAFWQLSYDIRSRKFGSFDAARQFLRKQGYYVPHHVLCPNYQQFMPNDTRNLLLACKKCNAPYEIKGLRRGDTYPAWCPRCQADAYRPTTKYDPVPLKEREPWINKHGVILCKHPSPDKHVKIIGNWGNAVWICEICLHPIKRELAPSS